MTFKGSIKGAGIGIEAGYAYSNNITIITIANNRMKATTLIDNSNCYYLN